jgi:hypothetical protein
VTVVWCLGVVSWAWAQDPAATAPQPHGRPTNLRVLPRDISEEQLGRLMKQYRDELGVTCGYCHVESPQTQKVDYVSDENPKKETARLMITMVEEINTKYLAQLGDRRYGAHVTCGNCHQGQSSPQPYEPR